MVIEISIKHKAWQTTLPKASHIVKQAVQSALAVTPRPEADELAVILANDTLLKSLNKEFRGIDKATNVLSFSYIEPKKTNKSNLSKMLGDIIISLDTARSEAKMEKIGLKAHVSHLVIHGVLHLMGYDHELDSDALIMEKLEIQALKRIGFKNPYD